MCLGANYAVIFKIDNLRSIINDKGLVQLFYNGFKKKVQDKLYKKLRLNTIDNYIAIIIRIDDRQFQRYIKNRVNNQDYCNNKGYFNNNRFNDKRKRKYLNTSYSGIVYLKPININNITIKGRKVGAKVK